jgi:uncharacterized membrane protein YkoI
MPKRMKQALVAGAAVATIGLGAAALVQASGSSEKDDANVTGAQAEQAKAAALRVTKGGTAGAVERDGDGGAMWEVEVTKPGGATADVELDANLKVVASEQDEDEGSEQDADEGETEQDDDERDGA